MGARILSSVVTACLWLAACLSAGAQPGPGPVPNPWIVSGNQISYPGCVVVPVNVAGGCKGSGSINTTALYQAGVPVLTTANFANPSASVGLTAVNGVATTGLRSDAAPPLSASVQSALTGTNHALLVGSGAFGFGSAGPCTASQMLTWGGGVGVNPSCTATLPSGLTAPSLTVTGAFTATGLVTNADLVNPSTTVNTQTCTLGSSCTVTAVASAVVVGTTLVTGGATTRILYDNAGVLGEYTISGTGTVVAMSAGPTISGATIGTSNFATGSINTSTIGNTNTVVLTDTNFTLQDDGNNTRQFVFQLSSITAGQTRAWTVPDLSDTFVGLTATQTLSNKTLASPIVTTLFTATGLVKVADLTSAAQTALTGANNGVLYGTGAFGFSALAVNATATNKFLTQVSSGAPAWNTIQASDLPGGSIANSVSNVDGTITISPTTGAVVASLALGHANKWTALQTVSFNAGTLPAALTGTVGRFANADGTITRMELDSFGTSTPGVYSCVVGRGTAASPTALQSGDEICSFNSWGYIGAATLSGTAVAAFRTYAAENFSAGHQGSIARIATTAIGASTLTDRVTINDLGYVGINQTVPAALLHIKGTAGQALILYEAAGLVNVSNGAQNVLQQQGQGNARTVSYHLNPGSGTIAAGTISEFVVEQTNLQAFGGNYGRWSFSCLDVVTYGAECGLIGEYGGTWTPGPFAIQMGIENPPGTFAVYGYMKLITVDGGAPDVQAGAVQFGANQPVPSASRNRIVLIKPSIGSAGQYDSDAILWEAKANDGTERAVWWRQWIDVTSNAGASQFTWQSNLNGAGNVTQMTLTDAGGLTVTGTLSVGSATGVVIGSTTLSSGGRALSIPVTDGYIGFSSAAGSEKWLFGKEGSGGGGNADRLVLYSAATPAYVLTVNSAALSATTFSFLPTTASSSVTTGAVVVSGGVGVSSNLWVTGPGGFDVAASHFYKNGDVLQLTSNNANNFTMAFGQNSNSGALFMGWYAHHSASAGIIQNDTSGAKGMYLTYGGAAFSMVSNTSAANNDPFTSSITTFQFGNDGTMTLPTTSVTHVISSTVASTSTATGALKLAGGFGAVGASNFGSYVAANSTANAIAISNGNGFIAGMVNAKNQGGDNYILQASSNDASGAVPFLFQLYMHTDATAGSREVLMNVKESDGSLRRLTITASNIATSSSGTFLSVLSADTATVDATVCARTSDNLLLKGTGALGICLGTSGAQFKDSFAPMRAGLAELVKIDLWNYRYRAGYGDGGARMQYGATAQGVETVLPDIVRHNDSGEAINYDSGALLFIGLHAIQQLKADNDNLRADNDNLRRDVEQLKRAAAR